MTAPSYDGAEDLLWVWESVARGSHLGESRVNMTMTLMGHMRCRRERSGDQESKG